MLIYFIFIAKCIMYLWAYLKSLQNLEECSFILRFYFILIFFAHFVYAKNVFSIKLDLFNKHIAYYAHTVYTSLNLLRKVLYFQNDSLRS